MRKATAKDMSERIKKKSMVWKNELPWYQQWLITDHKIVWLGQML